MSQRLLDDPQAAHAPEDADPLGPFHRQVPQPPEERFRRPARQQDRAVSSRERERTPFEQGPDGPFARGRETGRIVLAAADRADGTMRAIRRAGRADHRAQLHQRFVELPGAAGRQQIARDLPGHRLRVAGDGESAREHPCHVSVDQRDVFSERERCHRCGRVRSESRQRPKLRRGARERATARPRRAVKIAGARVVAEAAPEGEHVVERRDGERPQRRKSAEEAPVIRDHHLDPRLLQHHFAHPHAIRIARFLPPGKIAPRRREPRQQAVDECVIHARQ